VLGQVDLAVAGAVVGLRVLVPLVIPRYPLPAVLAALLLDAVDQTVFQTFTRLGLGGYQAYDKALDVYYLTIAYLTTFRSWTSLDAVEVGQVLFYARLIGVTLFEVLQARWLLLVFPNAFEYAFIAYEGLRTRWDPRRLTRTGIILAASLIWLAKLPQEWFIHVARLDFTDLVKRTLGYPATAPWGEVAAGSFPVFAVLAALLAGAILAANRTVRRWAPPADWPFTLDADRHAADVSHAAARAAAEARAATLIDRELVGKVVLVSLVCVVFAQIVPGVRASDLQLAMGVSFVVAVNTAFSESLVRRRVSWSSTGLEFAATATVNLLAAVGFELFFPVELASIDLPQTAFFVLLLTLIVTLYDRYRPFYLVRSERRQAAARRGGSTAAEAAHHA
jgi:hypothetical protein